MSTEIPETPVQVGGGQNKILHTNSIEENLGDEPEVVTFRSPEPDEMQEMLLRMMGRSKLRIKRGYYVKCKQLESEMTHLQQVLLQCKQVSEEDKDEYREMRERRSVLACVNMPEDGNFEDPEWRFKHRKFQRRLNRSPNYKQVKAVVAIAQEVIEQHDRDQSENEKTSDVRSVIRMYDQQLIYIASINKKKMSVDDLKVIIRCLELFTCDLEKFEPQGLDFTTFFLKIQEKCADVKQWTYEKIQEVIEMICATYKKLYDFISPSVSHVLDVVCTKMARMCYDAIFDRQIERLKDKIVSKFVFGILSIVALCIFCIALPFIQITGSVFTSLLDGIRSAAQKVGYADTVVEQFIPQDGGPLDAVIMISMFVGGMLSIPSIGVKRLTEICRVVTGLRTASTSAMDLAKNLLKVLPVCVQSAIIMKFGSSTEITEMNTEQWLTMARAVSNLRETGKVLISEKYRDLVREMITKGKALITQLPVIHPLRMYVASMLMKLGTIEMTITSNDSRNSARVAPFSVHFAGKPGVGKSINARSVMKRVSGIKDKEIYVRQPGTVHWDGYIDAKGVIFDEFLVSSSETINDPLLMEFLALVSSEAYCPPLPSVDRVSQGIKGSPAAPKIIATINNVTYCPMANIRDKNAFFRRRNIVVEFVMHPDAWLIKSGHQKKVDINHYVRTGTYEGRPWLKCNLHDGEGKPLMQHQGLTFDEAILVMQEMYDDHQTTGNAILERSSETTDTRTSDEILDDTIAEIYRSESHPLSFTELFGKFMTSDVEFVPQGGKKRMKKSVVSGTKPPLVSDDGSVSTTSDGTVTNESDVSTYSDASDGEESMDANETYLTEVPYADQYVQKDYEGTRSYPSYRSSWYIGVTAAMGLITALVSFISRFRKKDDYENQSGFASDNKSSKPSRRKEPSYNVRRGNRGYGCQAGVNPTVTGTIGPTHFRGIGWKERKVILPCHYMLDDTGEIWPDGTPMTFTYAKTTIQCKFNQMNYQYVCSDEERVLTEDVGVYAITDNHFPQFKDCTKKFLEEFDLQIPRSHLVQMRTIDNSIVGGVVSEVNNRTYRRGQTQFRLARSFVGAYNTQCGDCGGVVEIVGAPYAGRYLGFHTAGSAKGNAMTMPITREMLERFDDEDYEENVVPEDEEFVCQQVDIEDICGHNIKDITRIPKEQCIMMSQKSKIRPSEIAEYLPWDVSKEPAVLKKDDPRSDGSDPVINAIKRSANSPLVDVDLDVLNAVADTVVEKYIHELESPIGFRELTTFEAINGIPGVFKSIDTSTCPGWPLKMNSIRSGKRDHVWFDDTLKEYVWTPLFENMVDDVVEKMRNGVSLDQERYLMYMKDEGRSHEKVVTANTRSINSGNMIVNVAARKLFGSIMIAMAKSGLCSEPSIGINQHSHDMNSIAEYVNPFSGKTTYIAGDFKNFDQNQPECVTRKAYEVLARIMKHHMPNFDQKAWSVFTEQQLHSPVQVYNNLIWYHHYHASGALLTSHVNCVVVSLLIRYAFAKHNRVHQFDKCCSLKSMGDDHIVGVREGIDFTGRHIKAQLTSLGQIYTNANKEEDPGPNISFDQLTFLGAHPRMVNGAWTGAPKKQMLRDVAAQKRGNTPIQPTLDQMFDLASLWDEEFFNEYTTAINDALKQIAYPRIPLNYSERQMIQCSRTSDSETQYGLFYTQSGVNVANLGGNVVSMNGVSIYRMKSSINTNFSFWYVADTVRNDDWYTFDIAMIGSKQPVVLACDPYNVSPSQGKFEVDNTTCDMTLRLKIPGGCAFSDKVCGRIEHTGTEFTMSMMKLDETDEFWKESRGLTLDEHRRGTEETFEPQGLFDLFTFNNVSSNVQVRDVIGDVPIESAPEARNVRDDKTDVKTDLKLVPFDDTPLCSGSMPVMQAYSGLSKSVGIEPTVALQLHPAAMSRQHDILFEEKELMLEELMGKKCLVYSASWSDLFVPGTSLWSFELNSILGVPDDYKTAWFPDMVTQTGFPMNLALLNMFTFWRCEFELEFNVVRTKFHSGRLQLSVGYGARQDIAEADRSVYQNIVMDFSGENSTAIVTIPFNACTEYLRTYEGTEAPDTNQNYSLGYAGLFVANQLRRTETVPATVDVMVFLRLKNPRVSVPRPMPFVHFTSDLINEHGYDIAQTFKINNTGTLMDVHGFHEIAVFPQLALDDVQEEKFEPQMNTGYRVDGVTSLITKAAVTHIRDRPGTVSGMAIGEDRMDIGYGTDSTVFRESFEWAVNAPRGDIVKSYKLPWELLVAGNGDNLQNMPFERFSYFVTDVELTVQVNANPFQMGRIIVYFLPMTEVADIDLCNTLACDHILLDPQENTTGVLRIPYRFPRSVMNTSASDTESLGIVAFRILSQLKSVDSKPATISVYSRFPDAKFTIPRPIQPAVVEVFEPQSGGELITEASDVVEAPIHERDDARGDQENAPVNVAITKLNDVVTNKPGTLNLGHKFEYTPKSVLDWCRRGNFIGLIPRQAVSAASSEVKGSPFGDTSVYSVMVGPNNLMANFYGAWAGSMKYRIFIYNSQNNAISELTSVMFLPFVPPKDGATIVDSHMTHIYSGTQGAIPGILRAVNSYSTAGTNYVGISKAHEMDYKVNTKCGYIDVMVPFETHLNFLDTYPGQQLPGQRDAYLSPGTLILTFETSGVSKPTQARIAVAESVGDDFRFGLFRPPRRIRYLPVAQPDSIVANNNLRVGGYHLVTKL
jgi:hypothetical protein